MSYKTCGKRIFDFVCALIGFLVLSPLLVIIAILIKVESKGPVFFFQERMGKEGKIFRLVKFRSMYVDPAQEKKGFTPGDSSRITRIGKFIRKTKIDELPELINVIKGEMSLVGPRPEVPRYKHIYDAEYRAVLTLKPGITDPASIKYKDEEEILARSSDPEKMYIETILPDKLKINLSYLKEISFCNDLKIILDTIVRLIFRH
jgi:lipopolysaccharide/colanic/teichoic acid biosynthesis glycosyltransferase